MKVKLKSRRQNWRENKHETQHQAKLFGRESHKKKMKPNICKMKPTSGKIGWVRGGYIHNVILLLKVSLAVWHT